MITLPIVFFLFAVLSFTKPKILFYAYEIYGFATLYLFGTVAKVFFICLFCFEESQYRKRIYLNTWDDYMDANNPQFFWLNKHYYWKFCISLQIFLHNYMLLAKFTINYNSD